MGKLIKVGIAATSFLLGAGFALFCKDSLEKKEFYNKAADWPNRTTGKPGWPFTNEHHQAGEPKSEAAKNQNAASEVAPAKDGDVIVDAEHS